MHYWRFYKSLEIISSGKAEYHHLLICTRPRKGGNGEDCGKQPWLSASAPSLHYYPDCLIPQVQIGHKEKQQATRQFGWKTFYMEENRLSLQYSSAISKVPACD